MKAKAIWPYTNFYGENIDISNIHEKTNFNPSIPMEHFLYCEINHYFHKINELQKFLCECKYKADKDKYECEDFWMTPNEFECEKEGDCEDFALYTWRQLLHMGYDARFIVGFVSGNKGHAWCSAVIKNKTYFIEPLMAKLPVLPLFFFNNYQSVVSVGVRNYRLVYYYHKAPPKYVKRIYFALSIAMFTLKVIGIFIFVLFAILPALVRKKIKEVIYRYKIRYCI